jgi:DNA-binding XRE family transcriptional regulator
LALLHEAGDIYHDAIGADLIAHAHNEIPAREEIILEGPVGDLEAADSEDRCHLFRADRYRVKVGLFRSLLTQCRTLRDRCEAGEFFFSSKAPAISIAGDDVARLQTLPEIETFAPSPESKSLLRPGRKPQRVTDSGRLVDAYTASLISILRDRNIATKTITKNRLARVLGVSRDTLNLFEREGPGLKDKTRAKLQQEFEAGPTETIIALFIERFQRNV